MSTIRLTGSASGYTEVTAPAVAGSSMLVLPGGNDTFDAGSTNLLLEG
jgi:hypothetical protein